MTVYHMDMLLKKILVYEIIIFGLALPCSKCLSIYKLSASATTLRQAPIIYNILTNSTKQEVVAVGALDKLTLQRETTCNCTDGETQNQFILFQEIYCSLFFSIQKFWGRKAWGDQTTCLEAGWNMLLPGFSSTRLWDCHLFDYGLITTAHVLPLHKTGLASSSHFLNTFVPFRHFLLLCIVLTINGKQTRFKQ